MQELQRTPLRVRMWKFTHFFKLCIPVVEIPVFEPDSEKEILRILKKEIIKQDNQDLALYLIRYKNKRADHDECLPADKVPDAKVTLRKFRASNRGDALLKTP